MPKTKISRTSSAGQFVSRPSVQTELKIFRSVVAGLRKNPTKLRAVTVMAGISTPTGKLKKAYRSE